MAAQLPPAVDELIPAALLARVPGCGAGVPPCEALALTGGGRHNRCFKVTTREGRFVLRWRADTGERPGAAAAQELRCHLAAASLGIAPAIFDAAADGQWMVMEYVDAVPWQDRDLQDPARLETLGLRLAQVHDLAPRAVASLDLRSIIDGQLGLISARDPSSAARHEALRLEARDLEAGLGRLATRAVLNHGDLAAANLLGEAPMMVDWEYAQRADPVYDIACLLSYYPVIETNLDVLLGAAGLDDARSRASLVLHRRLFGIFNALWAEAQGAAHGDPAGIVLRRSAE
ncbi:MAG: hypothetical protein RLZZ393_725 [Pseudomonadota bacterium]|jgi:thiamine kinase-like enzyme